MEVPIVAEDLAYFGRTQPPVLRFQEYVLDTVRRMDAVAGVGGAAAGLEAGIGGWSHRRDEEGEGDREREREKRGAD